MGSERWYRDAFGGTGKIFKTIAAASLITVLFAATSRAGDISSQPADSLSVTNSVTNLLPQAPAATPPEPTAAAPPPGGEQSWLSGLHISGYASQTFGMWQDPPTLVAYTPSRNNLAVARSLLQIDGNYRLNENNTFFARGWFVYEPPYSFNSANNNSFAKNSNYVGIGGSNPFCKADPSCFRTAAGGVSFGARANGYLQHLRVARRVVGKQDRPADHLRRQPDRGVGTVAGLPRRRCGQSCKYLLGLRFRQPRTITRCAVDDPSDL